jgi:hypothetical protein
VSGVESPILSLWNYLKFHIKTISLHRNKWWS